MLSSETAVQQIEEFKQRTKHEDLPDGTYFQVRLGSHATTDNLDLWGTWRRMGAEAAKLSVIDANRQPQLSRELVQMGIECINRCFTDVVVRLVTNANDVFSGAVYGGPMGRVFEGTPIRWAGENEVGLNLVLSMASGMFQIPRMRANSFDHGIPRSAASAIMLPLFQQKGRLMREYFRKETQGHISPDELDAVFREKDVRPPLIASVRDRHDTAATAAKEDKRAMGDESAPTPTDEALVQIKSGVEVWTWVPTEADWVTFARVTEKMETEGPLDQPGPQFVFSTTRIAAGSTDSG